jgi:hypothetical protein
MYRFRAMLYHQETSRIAALLAYDFSYLRGLNFEVTLFSITGKDACLPNPCINAGKCFPAENRLGYHCICIEGKRGLQCERKSISLYSNPFTNARKLTKSYRGSARGLTTH